MKKMGILPFQQINQIMPFNECKVYLVHRKQVSLFNNSVLSLCYEVVGLVDVLLTLNRSIVYILS